MNEHIVKESISMNTHKKKRMFFRCRTRNSQNRNLKNKTKEKERDQDCQSIMEYGVEEWSACI